MSVPPEFHEEPPSPDGEDDYGYPPKLVVRNPGKPSSGPAVITRRLDPVGATNIPPRPWQYGFYLLAGTAAVVAAVDGGGKGAISVGIMLSTITGRPLLGERVWRSGPVVIVSYEDDDTEWHRRIAAACIYYDLDYHAAIANVHFAHRTQGKISFATQSGDRVIFPDSDEIADRIQDVGAVMVVIDPFNHAHDFEDGNNNVLIAKVAAEIGRIAAITYTSILVLHHLRKGSSGNPDDIMGATSLRATFRSSRVLMRMTPEVAEKMKVTDPWRYSRIAGSKENYAPPPEKSAWFKLVSVQLGNGTEEYPDGDNVGVATTWNARPMFEGMDCATLTAVFAALRETVHTHSKLSKSNPWAGRPLVDIGGRSEGEAAKIIKTWIDTGVLIKSTYKNRDKNEVTKVDLDEAKVSEILVQYADFPLE